MKVKGFGIWYFNSGNPDRCCADERKTFKDSSITPRSSEGAIG
jgi:hypothetical protein